MIYLLFCLVLTASVNLAYNKTTYQSSIWSDAQASYAVGMYYKNV